MTLQVCKCHWMTTIVFLTCNDVGGVFTINFIIYYSVKINIRYVSAFSGEMENDESIAIYLVSCPDCHSP